MISWAFIYQSYCGNLWEVTIDFFGIEQSWGFVQFTINFFCIFQTK